jgi:hypothetical protein
MDNIKPSVFPTPEQRAKAENDAEIARLDRESKDLSPEFVAILKKYGAY